MTQQLRRFKYGIVLFSLLISTAVCAHKDRMERPQVFQFILTNNDTLTLKQPSDSVLTALSNDIDDQKISLKKVIIRFETGEVLTLNRDKNRWYSIELADQNFTFRLFDTEADKISKIHFSTLALLWDGTYEHALTAQYFLIRFSMSPTRVPQEYSQMELLYAKKKFYKPSVWQQVRKASKK